MFKYNVFNRVTKTTLFLLYGGKEGSRRYLPAQSHLSLKSTIGSVINLFINEGHTTLNHQCDFARRLIQCYHIHKESTDYRVYVMGFSNQTGLSTSRNSKCMLQFHNTPKCAMQVV